MLPPLPALPLLLLLLPVVLPPLLLPLAAPLLPLLRPRAEPPLLLPRQPKSPVAAPTTNWATRTTTASDSADFAIPSGFLSDGASSHQLSRQRACWAYVLLLSLAHACFF